MTSGKLAHVSSVKKDWSRPSRSMTWRERGKEERSTLKEGASPAAYARLVPHIALQRTAYAWYRTSHHIALQRAAYDTLVPHIAKPTLVQYRTSHSLRPLRTNHHIANAWADSTTRSLRTRHHIPSACVDVASHVISVPHIAWRA
eukprot:2041366-Rhodomonas_salina.2